MADGKHVGQKSAGEVLSSISTAAPVNVVVSFPLRTGRADHTVLANSADAELVVHKEFTYPDMPASKKWAISSRRNGLRVNYSDGPLSFDSFAGALEFAAIIEPLFSWSELQPVKSPGSKPKGWSAEKLEEVRDQVELLHADWLEEKSRKAIALAERGA